MTNKLKNVKESAKALVSTKKEKEITLNTNVINETKKEIVNAISTKHKIENRASLSAKQLKAIRSKRRANLIKFANSHFTSLAMQKQSETLVNAKQFISFVAKHYEFTNLNFDASQLYSAKDAKTISDLKNLIDFCKDKKLAFKVYEDLN